MFYIMAREYEEWCNRPTGTINGFFVVRAENDEEAIEIAEWVIDSEGEGALYHPVIMRREETAEGFSGWAGSDFIRQVAIGADVLNRMEGEEKC